ncbi:replication-relaxation family protein (plasmid) [Lysinibacillus sphaericus]|uniref:Replication-relaxation n=1 Tax=Lysinibacillus sphaericus (strain C3-41) TaxID=444177 RepID=B1I072_LYSSC|nr:replication-relaxation family protein [Lysinibacillus sphaericus]MBE5085758.1 replication-relaxation family protein [Bacillus thuringiensis]ACA42231.1 hypothetical protein Bsph_p001 [Lysinibacillus sphaericus C3-41]AMO35375.1 hypothetical protein AR327_23070 [Lysinibacillus sphaericus]AMR93022.1 hypothetical protein A1T07_22715 [Lysinibacillus sphaericus]MBG9710632.1 hypothetical protein [Lysinibacillus sphaericus]
MFLERITERQEEILVYLFKVRGATVKQITQGVFSTTEDLSDSHLYRKMFDTVNRLEKKQLITSFASKYSKALIYFLTEKGLNMVYDFLFVPLNHTGKGFNDDYGYFKHSVHMPPKLSVNHFLQQTNFYNIVLALKKKVPGAFDYRDNLYAAKQYDYMAGTTNITGAYKPDGELLVEDQRFFIEVDTGSEYSSEFQTKFNNLFNYLQSLANNGEEIPTAIVFVANKVQRRRFNGLVNPSEQRRYFTIKEAFEKACGNFTKRVDLVYLQLKQVERYFLQFTREEKRPEFNKIANQLNRIKKFNYYKGERDDEFYFQDPDNPNLTYFVMRIEAFSNLRWKRLLQVMEKQEEGGRNMRAIVFYEHFFSPPLHLGDRSSLPAKTKELYDKIYHLKLSDNGLQWYNPYHESINAPFQ